VSDLEVPAGGHLALALPFAPPWTAAGGGERQARLRLWTDDPYRPESSVELVGLAYEGEAVVERFVYAPASMTDLLLVSDPGGVMDAYLGLASGALGGLVDGLVEANVDLHAAALSAGGDCPVWSDAADPAATCLSEISEEPEGWTDADFDTSAWASATVHSAADVDPKEGYTEISWSADAELIWASDLESDNTVLCKVTVEGV
jgi:hypothetical protein